MLPQRWRDALARRRNQIILSPRVQRWATAIPFTRPVVRRKAQQVFDLCAGFVYSQTLFACVELDVLQSLVHEPSEADALLQDSGLDTDARHRLLESASAIDLIQRQADGRYRLGALGAALMANTHLLPMIRHHALFYSDLSDPVERLRNGRGGGQLGRFWAYSGIPGDNVVEADSVADYSALMSATQTMVAEQVLNAIDLSRFDTLLDVGGGSGAFARAVLENKPDVQVSVFDLPAVVERQTSEDSPITWHGGSFIDDPIPRGYDAISLVRILHDHDDPVVRTLLTRVHDALEPGANLIIAEPLASTPGAETVGAYFHFYLHAMGSGRPRSFAELQSMLQQAGFERIRRRNTRLPMITSVITATRGHEKCVTNS